MASPPVNPAEVFRSSLPAGTSLIVIFVPSKDRNGSPIDQEYWVDQILTALGQLFAVQPPTRAARACGAMMNAAGR